MLRVLKYEIEAKERSVSVGVSSFERQAKKVISCVLQIVLYKAATKIRFVYYVTQNRTLHGVFFYYFYFMLNEKRDFLSNIYKNRLFTL